MAFAIRIHSYNNVLRFFDCGKISEFKLNSMFMPTVNMFLRPTRYGSFTGTN
jgi:hypothetical protein